MALEVGDHTYATVAVWDAHGNPVDAAYTLEVTGGPATLTGDDIEVLGEGWYTFWARIDGTALADSVGPLLVDSTGPVVIIESPDRGATAAEGTGSVWGTATDAASGIVSLTVNGTSVPVSDDGSFSANVPWGFGLNVVEVAAVDGDGNGTTVNRAVLAGDFRAAGASVGGGVLARLNEGPGGIDELEEIGEGLIGSAELDDLIPSPVFSDSYEECVWGFCFTVYSATVYVNNPYIGGTDLQIDPGGDGRLRASLTVSNPSLQWSASGDLAEIGYSGSGSIWADSITVGMALLPSVSGGNIALSVESVWVSSSGFHFDVDSWLYDVLEFFGVDLNSLIQGYMEDALYDAVYDAVPDLLGDALQDLELAYTLSLLGQDYHVLAPPDRVSVDETGLTVSLATTFWPDDRIVSGPGSLYAGYPAPALGGGNGLIAGLSQDFLNQAFEGFWGGGMLHQTFTDEDLGLDVADLALFVPGLTDLSITTEPYLPPVVVPGSGASMLDLGVGDLLVTVWNGAAAPGNEVLQAWVSAIAGLDLVAAGDASFTATLGDAEIWVDVVWPEANTSEAAAYEGLVQMLVPPLLPEVAGALGEIAIPEIAGFTLTGVSAGIAGAEGGYVTLGGDLVSL
ncbi:hypothetical protein L6R50_13130 [Myxococcota bacterium]|nr:hypothetical protein [Myxococcota bacterium]